jgi:tripartite-type tricarboxylate transporter receptor subunit TctC
MTTFPRRRFLQLAAGAAALPSLAPAASAQTWPVRPITVIVPFAAGGPSDVAARIVSEHMSRTLGQQFVVENVVGAGGTIGSVRNMRAAPDGYTIQMGHMGTHAIAVSLCANLAYKPETDFAPIGVVVS